MTDTNIYLGRLGSLTTPGSLLVVPHPKGVFDAPRQRLLDIFELGAGGARVDQMVGGARAYSIPYDGLTMATFARLQAYADGHEGPGPFVFLDPGQRNMLPADMSAATSVTNGVDAFTVAGDGCTIDSSDLYTDAGPRTLRWTFNSSTPGSGAALTPNWPSSTFAHGIPVVLGRPVCFSVYVRGGGTDRVVTYTPQIVWRDAAGAVVSTTSGSALVSDDVDFVRGFATGTPPATAVYADWRIAYTSGAANVTDDFESGVAAWTPTGGTFVSSTAQAHGGTKSGLLTVTGSPAQAYVRQSAGIPVTPATSYTAAVWCYSAAGYADVGGAIDWFDAGGGYISSTPISGAAIAAATWTLRTVTGAAPAGAVTAVFGPTLGSSPPNGTALFVDDASFAGNSIGYFRRFMFNEGSTPDTTWVPGTGVWPVKVTGLGESWLGRFSDFRSGPTFTLQEDTS